MKKVSLLLLSLLMSVSVLIIPAIGCDNDNQTIFEEATIIDDLGREVSITEEPMRIVSLAPSNTEILFALGLGDKVFGVTEYCDYPDEALTKEFVGGYSGVDIEKVVSINPDLILAADMHKTEVIPALEDLGFTVIALVPHNLQEVMDSIKLVGTITGTGAAASQIVDDMSQRIKAVTDVTGVLTEKDKVKVLYVIWHEPIMSVGTDTRIHELIEKAGGINIAEVAGEGYPTLALEEIISINPQVIIVNDDMSLDAILNDERLSGVDAVVNGKVYTINADLTNRPTPRIVEGLEIIAEMIHPELFGNTS
ncbi:MAG: cobalamin-binding protein [Dehalococcoidales bacterium]|nr:cobalamin-binding protein [Dehalococcoidales bacterium]